MAAFLTQLRSWTARPARFFAAALALAALAAGVERGIAAWRGHELEPGREARWIWARGVHQSPEPVAFYAVRDVDLPEGLDSARLSIVADETYCLYLNGRLLGAGSYRAGAAVDRYAVGDHLVAGRNRLTVELRSRRGAGGLLATLSPGAADPRELLVTDGDWRIFRRHDRRLFEPDAPLPGSEPPQVWHRSPTGRWRIRPAERDRPIAYAGGAPRVRHPAVAVRKARDGARWIDITRPRRQFPVLGPRLLLDWGEEVEGFLELDLASPEPPPALAYFGAEPPEPDPRYADEVLIFVPGRAAWRSAHPRRFRYALLIGVQPRTRVRVLELDAGVAAELAPPPPEAGVFGVQPLEPQAAAVDGVWKRIHRKAEEESG